MAEISRAAARWNLGGLRGPPGRVPARPGQVAARPVDRLADLGRPQDALDAGQEAVTIRRELAARWPDAYRHGWNSRCELLPGFSTVKATHPRRILAGAQDVITVRYHFHGHNFRAGHPTPSCAPTVVAATCGPAMSIALRRRMSPLTSRSNWSCSCPACWKQAVFVSAWLAGPRQVPARCLDRRPRHCTAQYGTTRHETPCDRRHTDVLTKVLTTRLGKPSDSRQTRRSPVIQDGVSDGI